jgi:membrane-associated protein
MPLPDGLVARVTRRTQPTHRIERICSPGLVLTMGVTSMNDLLSVVTSPLWAYAALWALLAIDAFIPVLPTQAIMITSGVLAAQGELNLPTAIGVGAAGVLCGDLAWWGIGRAARSPAGDRAASSRWRARLTALATAAPGAAKGPMRTAARLTRGLRQPGPLVILLGRFVPGGRMAACFFAGRTRYPSRRFLAYELTAALAWASYGGVVGNVGGDAVARSAWLLVAVAAVGATIFATAGWLLALARPDALLEPVASSQAGEA